MRLISTRWGFWVHTSHPGLTEWRLMFRSERHNEWVFFPYKDGLLCGM